jgi:hypothetical protein
LKYRVISRAVNGGDSPGIKPRRKICARFQALAEALQLKQKSGSDPENQNQEEPGSDPDF